MDLNPIYLPSLAKQIKCSFLDYIQLLMIGWAGQWTQTPSTTPLQPKNEMLIFGLRSISDDQSGWSMDSNPHPHPSPAKKMKCLFLDYVQLLMIGWAGRWTQTPSATPLQPRNKMLIFGLHSTSGDRPGWSMDSNPIHHPSPAKKMKCSLLDYVQLLMISQVIQATNSDWNAKKSLIHQKMKCSFFWWSTRRLPEDHQKTVRRLLEVCQKVTRRLPEVCQKITRRLSEDYQKTSRRPAEDHQKTARRPVEDCQKITRRPLAVFWWSSNDTRKFL